MFCSSIDINVNLRYRSRLARLSCSRPGGIPMTSQYQKLAMAFFHPSLREDPFNPEDSARYFYLAEQYKEALDLLMRHVLMRRGLWVMYGDVGMGKSSLLAVLRQRMHANEMFKPYVIGEILDPSQPSDV